MLAASVALSVTACGGAGESAKNGDSQAGISSPADQTSENGTPNDSGNDAASDRTKNMWPGYVLVEMIQNSPAHSHIRNKILYRIITVVNVAFYAT